MAAPAVKEASPAAAEACLAALLRTAAFAVSVASFWMVFKSAAAFLPAASSSVAAAAGLSFLSRRWLWRFAASALSSAAALFLGASDGFRLPYSSIK